MDVTGIQELVGYSLGALILLGALAYGTIQYLHRSKRLAQEADAIVKERYKHNDL